jgi:membrane protein implicated in regulation of membrane protease activity
MQWWAWVTIGAVLLGSELTLVNADFYLVFVGGAALVVGVADLAGLHLADWLQWLAFIVLAVVSLVAFRRRVYERLRPSLPTVKCGPEGDTVVLPASLPPGETTRLEFRGSTWSAVNGGRSVIEAGARARIERVDGLTLVVHGDGNGP